MSSIGDLFRVPKPPVKKALSALMISKGPELDITTHAGGALVRAVDMGGIYVDTFNLEYVRARLERLERLAISVNGQGRRDLIDAVGAGGSLPSEYYRPGAGAGSTFSPINKDDEE